MAQEQRDYYPNGAESISGIKGKFVNIKALNAIAPIANYTLEIPANPGRLFVQIYTPKDSALGVPYTGTIGVWLMNEAQACNICTRLEAGGSVLINKYTFPWCGTIWVIADASADVGAIYTTEGTVE